MARELYIGLMSGTSADGADAALMDFSSAKGRLVGTASHSWDRPTRAAIHRLARSGSNEIDSMGALDHQLGRAFADLVLKLLAEHQLKPGDIQAIGSHGQTLRHRPAGTTEYPFSLQIGDPNIIAHTTGITTLADFRRRDMAAGGQGAPLVPAFHQAQFASPQVERAIVNIGGIANLTWLPPQAKPVLGFDTGPGNGLMDAWIGRLKAEAFDREGAWAASGQPNEELLRSLQAQPYFKQPPPKSTGPEVFNLDWLDTELSKLSSVLQPEDVQASLLELTAWSIARSLGDLSKTANAEVYLCGGGAFNRQLRHRLQAHLPQFEISDTSRLGIEPEWVEAAAFAWLAHQTMNRQAGNLPSVTGAQKPVILGAVYYA